MEQLNVEERGAMLRRIEKYRQELIKEGDQMRIKNFKCSEHGLVSPRIKNGEPECPKCRKLT